MLQDPIGIHWFYFQNYSDRLADLALKAHLPLLKTHPSLNQLLTKFYHNLSTKKSQLGFD